VRVVRPVHGRRSVVMVRGGTSSVPPILTSPRRLPATCTRPRSNPILRRRAGRTRRCRERIAAVVPRWCRNWRTGD
jgi:hypothetical protein